MSDPNNSYYNPYSPDYDSTRDRNSDTYIDRRGTVDTGADVREQASRDVDAEDASDEGGWFGLDDLIEKLTREGRIRDHVVGEWNDQARQLAAGLDTRPSPAIDCANYLSYEHQQLQTMVTDGADAGAVGEAGDMWIEVGNTMIRFQDDVAAAINNSEADWQGAAANQVRGFMADVGNWVGTAGQGAALAGTQTNLQAEALSTASNSMPEEVPFDRNEWLGKIMTSPNPLSTYTAAIAQYYQHQQAHEQAARVVSTYDSSLAGASTMPAFTPPPTMGGGDGDPSGSVTDGGGVGGLGGGTTGPGGTGGGGSGGFGGSGSGGGTGGGFVPPPGGGGSGGSGSGGGFGELQPAPGATMPGGVGPGGSGGVGSGGSSGQLPGSSGSGGSGLLPGGLPIGPGGAGGLRGGGDSSRGPGSRGGIPGSGTGGRSFGPGGGAGGFGGTSSGSGGSSGAGGRGLGGAGALAAEHAAGGGRGGGLGGAAGGRGAGGGMPMGAGGGRGQGDEDGEHQRPAYLVEADPDSLFGTDQMTAPPVIGE